VMQDARLRLPAKPCHRQRVGDQIGGHARLDRPADRFPIEQSQNNDQIQPAFLGPQIGDVRRSDAIGRSRGDVAVKQIICDRHAVAPVPLMTAKHHIAVR
jgi:hypothetical protein